LLTRKRSQVQTLSRPPQFLQVRALPALRWSRSLHPWAAVGPRVLRESNPTGPPRAERPGSRPSQRPRRVITAAVQPMSWSGLMPIILPLTTCAAIQHVGERRAHPLPHRDPSANRRATLCAQPAVLVGRRSKRGRSRRLSASQDSGQVRGRRLRSPSTASAAPFAPDSGRRPAARGHGGRPRQGRPAPNRGAALHRRAPQTPACADRADADARRTDTDTRTADTRRTRHRTPDTGRGHPSTPGTDARTPDADIPAHPARTRGQATNGTASIRTSSTATTTKTAAGTANPSSGAGACGSAPNDGSAMGTLRARPQPPSDRAAARCRSAVDGAPRRTALVPENWMVRSEGDEQKGNWAGAGSGWEGMLMGCCRSMVVSKCAGRRRWGARCLVQEPAMMSAVSVPLRARQESA